MNKIKEKDSYY